MMIDSLIRRGREIWRATPVIHVPFWPVYAGIRGDIDIRLLISIA